MSRVMFRFVCTKLSAVMPGLVPGIHVFRAASKAWMAGTSPAMTWRWLMLIAGACSVASAARDTANAQQRPTRLEIWDLKLGTAATDLPDEFTDYACGTNGGPPSLALSPWRAFRRRRPQPSRPPEGYFRYAHGPGAWAKANNFGSEMRKYSGTKVFDFPVALSARFDERGILSGIRIVSDPRDTSRDREEGYLLRNFLSARYGREGWDCVDLPPEEGETPVFRHFIQQISHKSVHDTSLPPLP